LLLGEFAIACYNMRLMSAITGKTFPLVRYLSEVKEELKRVSWPNRQQTLQKTTLVVVASISVGAYIGLLDYIYTQIMGFLLK
jgi:preprotein translocase subunit SecE